MDQLDGDGLPAIALPAIAYDENICGVAITAYEGGDIYVTSEDTKLTAIGAARVAAQLLIAAAIVSRTEGEAS